MKPSYEYLVAGHRIFEDEIRFLNGKKIECTISHLDFLSECIFNFTTYQSDISEFLATKALDVCEALTEGETYEYIQANHENHIWYITMCNLPFFRNKICWGTSIRGAWWDEPIMFDSYQIIDNCHFSDRTFELSRKEWGKFTRDIIRFGRQK